SDPELLKRVYSRGQGPLPTRTVPDYILEKRKAEELAKVHKIQASRASLQFHVMETEVEEEDAM
ncbi:hypothetical protein ABTE11_22080, partial [Acinetobacter baumannii]